MSHGGGGDEGEGSSERWLVSYSDFITLLMVMFVVLYSMGQVDVEKYKRLADSMRAAFTVGGGASDVIDSSINQAGGTQEDGQPNPIVIPGIPEEPPQSVEVAGQLTSMLSQQNLGNEVSVQTNIEGVLISLGEKLVFKTGTAELQDDAYPVLDTIVEMLTKVKNSIRVVGHTDDSPPTDPRYKDNWELSVGRAITIADYLIEAGIDPARILVSGRGEYQPIFPNDTPEHRALNGRADIVIIYKVESQVIDVNSEMGTPTQAPEGGNVEP
ncbi:MAG TPA: flagellar motor protein MotB [Anaerolineaceae bacterium]|nr:flagellar motor protein MotB [Anaerolineaceae bacterium]